MSPNKTSQSLKDFKTMTHDPLFSGKYGVRDILGKGINAYVLRNPIRNVNNPNTWTPEESQQI